ncbi:thiamine-phosphate kinase [Zafaria sp. Z1313]|uniref:thiamine-phosphate kinase n=1 Tax=Zafaria sp. Z1313 TaxID=3423202 RepID=UPI003D30370D
MRDADATIEGLGEAGLLDLILPRLQGAGALLGPGDDAAMIAAPDGRFVVSIDTLVEDQDFRLVWPCGYRTTGFDVGWKAAAQNLSDINAMGAVATSAVISLTLPGQTPVGWVTDLADGFSAACRELGATRCAIAGGDLGRGEGISVTTAVTGDLEGRAPVLRSGAKPGDVLAVTAGLGRAATGLALLESRDNWTSWSRASAELVRAQLRPRPPLSLGPEAARGEATAMMDLSDGLARDGGRLAHASGLALKLDAAALVNIGTEISKIVRVGSCDPLELVCGGGEDFGLLATFAPGALPGGFVQIGRAVDSKPGVTLDGRPLDRWAWDHFR